MAKNNTIQIGGELVNPTGDGVVADAEYIKDYYRNKSQKAINDDVAAALAAIDDKTTLATQEEVESIVTNYAYPEETVEESAGSGGEGGSNDEGGSNEENDNG